MSMTIPQALQWWQHRLGRTIQFPVIPPACAQIMEQARAAGIPVGTLYIVSRPLVEGTLGTYDQATGDICCHYEASQGVQGQRGVLQSLLILLAGIKLHVPVPQTIAQEWESVRQAIEEGYVLAQQWGYTEAFAVEDFTRLMTRSAELAYCHHLAAELAGNRLPWVAHTAYTALSALRKELPMLDTWERFVEALSGTSTDPQANNTLVTFDRSLLRERWSVTSSRAQGNLPSFGELVVPCSTRSAQLLRVALSRAAGWPHDAISEHAFPARFQEITDEADLAVLVRVFNGWLIDTHPKAAIRLLCWAYGDGHRLTISSPRVYRLSLSYEDALIEGPATRNLWVLFAARPTTEQQALEAAWQTFLSSWLTCSELQCESLANGLQILWRVQGGQA